ncbi:hypothetical protein acsn021_44660 [Anaerocolumna cellulosilytica]|uniref:Uncharacterized protein n=1 Tax=Anaerocolumna cellulosilytica TaxID=433286 RepID=A0A6S6R9S4_9FIRM|nr:hypothetical protein [Anaerocolumna cellulosilytica]MBB5195887.1 hypothetical protein [Anaerocolumna cellulosilytica]BCJ96897.1 hypothetical protein acsn021_44660 [Anaerocolumna cellulosilytica]
MAVLSFNYDSLISQVQHCCLTENTCGKCQKEACLIGYCRQVLLTCIKQNGAMVDGGMEHIPFGDMRLYDDETIINALAYMLHECRNCNTYHSEECIINILRSTFEIILLGEAQEYKGSTLVYLNDIKSVNPEIADKIFQAFKEGKK